jgi:integrase
MNPPGVVVARRETESERDEQKGEDSMTAKGVVQRGSKWSVVLDLGNQPFRQCPKCKRRFWMRDITVATCKRDGCALDRPRIGRRQQWLSGFKTKPEAAAAAEDARSKIRTGSYTSRTDETLSDYLGAWLDRRTDIEPTTRSNYEVTIRAYIAPKIGDLKLAHVTADVLDDLYARLLKSGGRNGRPLARKTVRNVHLVLHKALDAAVRKQKLALNPADAVSAIPKPEKRQARERRMRQTIWSPAEMRTFLEAARSDRYAAAWVLLATTGLRRGELLGLPWSSVDLDAGTIRIEQSLVLVGRELTISSVKSDGSAAELAIDAATVAALRQHRAQQLEEQMAERQVYDGSTGLVFLDEVGAMISPDAFLRRFKRKSREAGLREVRLHDVRHSYASALLSAGLPMKVISERLRHSGLSITADLYTHLAPEVDRAAAETGAAFILGG